MGELDPEKASLTIVGVRKACCGSVLSEERLRELGVNDGVVFLPSELLGDEGTCSPLPGDEDNEPALKGWNDTDVLRGRDAGRPSDLNDDFDPDAVL